MKKVLVLIVILVITCGLYGCDLINHEHTFSKEWVYDKEYHWHEADCGHDAISGKSEHILTDNKCDFCGYVIREDDESTNNNTNNNDNINNNGVSYLSNRYEVHSAPITNGSLPLIDSSTDYTYNYYLVDGGYIKNVPISSGVTMFYDGKTKYDVTYGKSEVTTQRVENSMNKTVMESISESNTGNANVTISAEVEWSMFSVDAELIYSRQWGTIDERQNSFTSIYTVATEKTEQITTEIRYTIGNNNEPAGSYRWSYVTTCDVYYLVKTNRENTEMISCNIVLNARNEGQFMLEYSQNGDFNKTSDSNLLGWPVDFYKNFPIPNKSSSSKITLDECGGYIISQKDYEVELGLSYKLPVTQKLGYAFVGWYSSPNGEGTRYTDHNGNSINNWEETDDKKLYAHWVKITSEINIGYLQLHSEQCYSAKSTSFSIGLDVEILKSIGYTNINIDLTGYCSDYYYKLNDRTRYIVLSDAVNGQIATWKFIVSGFNGIYNNIIPLSSFNTNGSYQLQLVSDYSPNYDEKLKVNDIRLTITAVK